jgi:hypothetical protein
LISKRRDSPAAKVVLVSARQEKEDVERTGAAEGPVAEAAALERGAARTAAGRRRKRIAARRRITGTA